jgi:hypothetical protein
MRSMKIIVVAILATVGIAQGIGCETGKTNQQQSPYGTVRLPLTATVGANNYVLSGTFVITNSTGVTTTLSSTSASTAATLVTTLGVGQYTITLLPGWQLSIVSASGTTSPIAATLISPATQSVNITNQQNTIVTYQFNSNGVVIETGQGQMTVQIGVTENAGGTTSAGGSSSTAGGASNTGGTATSTGGLTSTGGQSSSGVCNSPNQTCNGACVNLSTDTANCGSCGHSCGSGATCSGGQCQPMVMTSGLGGYSFVFGVDASYVYYNNCSSFYTCTPLRIALGAVGGAGTVLTSLTTSGIGVIGNTLLLFQNQIASFLCDVGSACSPTTSTRLGNGTFAGFKSPSPSYFALSDYSNASTDITTWYTTGNSVQSSFSWTHTGGLSSFAQVGNAVYFCDTDASGSTYSVWGTVGFPASTMLQLAGGITFYPTVVDANSKSLIYQDGSTKYLYRVPLPGGMGTAAPQNIAGANGTKFVTEDANGIYWIDSTGNLNRCLAPACAGNTVMTTGQILGSYFTANSTLGALYQDSSYLYWINGSGQLMKLAK